MNMMRDMGMGIWEYRQHDLKHEAEGSFLFDFFTEC